MTKITDKAQVYTAKPKQTFREAYDCIQGENKQHTDTLRREFIIKMAKLTFSAKRTVMAWLYNKDQTPNAYRRKAIADYLKADVEHLFPTQDV